MDKAELAMSSEHGLVAVLGQDPRDGSVLVWDPKHPRAELWVGAETLRDLTTYERLRYALLGPA